MKKLLACNGFYLTEPPRFFILDARQLKTPNQSCQPKASSVQGQKLASYINWRDSALYRPSLSIGLVMHHQESNYLIAYGVKWVTVDRCAELVGWTKDAINALRVKGQLRMDIHWTKRNGRIFIDMVAFQRWIETGS